MKFKYFYQQLISHTSVIIIAFLLVGFLFAQFVEQYIYNSKTEELITYGETILDNMSPSGKQTTQLLDEYGSVLQKRPIHFSLFNEASEIIYTVDGRRPNVQLEEDEWKRVTEGEKVIVKKDFEQFNEGVTYVIVPYFRGNIFGGGILLASPLSGISKAIDEMNQLLWKSVYIAIAVALILSALLARFHVKRINALKYATSKVAKGDYNVVIPHKEVDEIDELANDFNDMVEKLQNAANEIDALENRRRQFMADVSHELKTPLTTIHGMIEGLENKMIPLSEQERALELTKQETKRLIRLVNENLDYEKIRSNQINLEIISIELEEVYEIVKEQLGQMAVERNNEIVIDVAKGMVVKMDYDRLLQIIINIVKNSIQFTENGRITMAGYETATKSIIKLSDTGSGMDEEVIENIWERFYKAGVSRTNNRYGEFGLGLSIVKQLVTLHKGQINVTSEPNSGTIFTIEIPKMITE